MDYQENWMTKHMAKLKLDRKEKEHEARQAAEDNAREQAQPQQSAQERTKKKMFTMMDAKKALAAKQTKE